MNQFQIKFETPAFDDLSPHEKSTAELVELTLRDADGEVVDMRKYTAREKSLCARKLILGGFLRGTVVDRFECVWSRPTRKGRMILEDIRRGLF